MKQRTSDYYSISSGETVTVLASPIGCGNQVTAQISGNGQHVIVTPGGSQIAFTITGLAGQRKHLVIAGQFLANDSADAVYGITLRGDASGPLYFGGSILRPDTARPFPPSQIVPAIYHFEIE
jgi:hypothetical protein